MSSLSYQNLDESEAFGKLQTISPWDVTQLSPQRLRENTIPVGGELSYCFGAKSVDDSTRTPGCTRPLSSRCVPGWSRRPILVAIYRPE